MVVIWNAASLGLTRLLVAISSKVAVGDGYLPLEGLVHTWVSCEFSECARSVAGLLAPHMCAWRARVCLGTN